MTITRPVSASAPVRAARFTPLPACGSLTCRYNLTMRITLLLLTLAISSLPAPHGQAATARDVEIPAGKATIAGTLLSPTPSVAVPCVVILGGTLSHTRDGALTDPGVPNRNALKRLADALAAAGYASLRYDRVGYGQSKPG